MITTISEDDWNETYVPQPAPSGNGGFDYGNGSTLLDWTHPGDLAVLEAANEACVWTVVDGDDGPAIVTGRHFVNRMGYIVTANARDTDDIEIQMDS